MSVSKEEGVGAMAQAARVRLVLFQTYSYPSLLRIIRMMQHGYSNSVSDIFIATLVGPYKH